MSVEHGLADQHQHPMLPGTKPKSVTHFDCKCGARCLEPHVWAYHIERLTMESRHETR